MASVSYSKNKAWHVNAGSQSIMKEPYVQLDRFGWIQVLCRGCKSLAGKKAPINGVWSSFRQSHVREPG